ncbi:MAG: Capsular glucan synthase [Syntrophorhabdus sp. PtaU1.Bin153]|nr:MAG: Capsular glucan synthase [Syntrophorhabdus sp. PtaU1.Bin153]
MLKQRNTILHLIASNFFGGPEKQIVEHLKRLDREKFSGIVASFIENGSVNEVIEVAKAEQLAHFGIPMAGPVDIRALLTVANIVRNEDIKLICAHGYKATIMSWWVGRRQHVPVLAFSRGYTRENLKVAFYEWAERQILGSVDGVICVAQGQSDRLTSLGVKPRQTWVVHNAVKTTPLLDEKRNSELRKSVLGRLQIPAGGQIVVTAGRLSPEKGHRFLVDAAKILCEKRKGIFFVFCGDGVCKADLQRQATRLGIEQWIRFAGFRRDLMEIFSVMDMLVLPSLTEALPNVVLEAFACAKPAVATKVGGVPEIVIDGVNGFLVLPERADLLAGAMEKLIESPSLGISMGKAGYQKVITEFDFDVQAAKLMEVYTRVLDSRHHQKRFFKS